MRHRFSGLLAFSLALSLSLTALAGDDAKGDGSHQKKAEGAEREDPEGIMGAGPFKELIDKGNDAYIARNYVDAATTYREAIQKKPKHPLGHYMLGQAYLADKKLEDADRAWQSALRFAEKKPVMRAKALFVIADLRERQQKWDDAALAWKAYAEYTGANPDAHGYPATPTERQKAIEKRSELATKYAQVKERIAQREKDAAAKAEK